MGQRMLTLAFLCPTPGDHWVNRLTAKPWVSRHPFCHVELFFESINQCFSILWGETVGFRVKNLSNPNYKVVSLSVSVKEYNCCLEFCRSAAAQQIGFDEAGMWRSWFSPAFCCVAACEPASHTKNSTFCSKIITEALQFAGVAEVDRLAPSGTTPSRLYECVHLSPRMACSSVPFKRQALIMYSSMGA
jgi:hypothetical protein